MWNSLKAQCYTDAHCWTQHWSSPEAMSDSPEWIFPEARGSDGPPLNCLSLLRDRFEAFIIAQCWFRLGLVPVALSTVMGWKWDFEKLHIQHPSRSLQLIDVTPVLRRAWEKKRAQLYFQSQTECRKYSVSRKNHGFNSEAIFIHLVDVQKKTLPLSLRPPFVVMEVARNCFRLDFKEIHDVSTSLTAA